MITHLSDLPEHDRDVVNGVVGRLSAQFANVFGPETIERMAIDSLLQLATGRSQAFLPLLTERFTRERLEALGQFEGSLTSERPSVLFLCVHNAGRSQMAASFLRQLSRGDVVVYSGGSEPASQINPTAVEAMNEVGIDISEEFPKPWTDEVVRAVDVVVSMGCGDACPVYPGKRYEEWELDDPAGRGVDEVRVIRDDIRSRVLILMNSLGVDVHSEG